jgi:hypothetical protein
VRLLAIRKSIVKRVTQSLLDRRRAIERQRMIEIELKESQIVQPKNVVSVFVRIRDRMHDADSFTKQLETQIGRSVHQQIPFR